MNKNKDLNGDNFLDYNEAAKVIEKTNNSCSWPEAAVIFKALAKFMDDENSSYDAFEGDYINSSSSGKRWADPRITNLLQIFKYRNGPRSFQRAREQHDSKFSKRLFARHCGRSETGEAGHCRPVDRRPEAKRTSCRANYVANIPDSAGGVSFGSRAGKKRLTLIFWSISRRRTTCCRRAAIRKPCVECGHGPQKREAR